MNITFYKYQGTGNDFILIDNRHYQLPQNDTETVAHLCDRKFGVGADGLIFLENDESSDFRMVYYNADGNQSTMCGNGGRCIVAFAKFLGVIESKCSFNAIDGLHYATINDDYVELQMQDVSDIQRYANHLFLDTGSPHHVQMESDLDDLDIKNKGANIRYGELYGKAGSNVNFVNKLDDSHFRVRTYERGVEDETLSCGTGVTAVAIAMNYQGNTSAESITLESEGGPLQVSFERDGDTYKKVFLKGPAVQVFKGEVNWKL